MPDVNLVPPMDGATATRVGRLGAVFPRHPQRLGRLVGLLFAAVMSLAAGPSAAAADFELGDATSMVSIFGSDGQVVERRSDGLTFSETVELSPDSSEFALLGADASIDDLFGTLLSITGNSRITQRSTDIRSRIFLRRAFSLSERAPFTLTVDGELRFRSQRQPKTRLVVKLSEQGSTTPLVEVRHNPRRALQRFGEANAHKNGTLEPGTYELIVEGGCPRGRCLDKWRMRLAVGDDPGLPDLRCNLATIFGTGESERRDGTDGVDRIDVLGGDDRVFARAGDDRVCGNTGKDTLEGNAGRNFLAGGEGDDKVLGGDDRDEIEGDGGDDRLDGQGGNDTLSAGAGIDTLHGNRDEDNLFGEDDNDELHGDAGPDHLNGGDGLDDLFGGRGQDDLFGGPGRDELFGGIGVDRLRGREGRDELTGGSGKDTLSGGDRKDVLAGGGDNDVLGGGAGIDELFGNAANDELFGDAGDDVLNGGPGDDTLRGGENDDTLRGGADNDELFGGPGSDVLDGGPGFNTCFLGVGNEGEDTFFAVNCDVVFPGEPENRPSPSD